MAAVFTENRQVLQLAEALLGLVSPNFRLVTLRPEGDRRIVLRFVLEREDVSDREAISTCVARFARAERDRSEIHAEIVVDSRALGEWPELTGRPVFGRMERPA